MGPEKRKRGAAEQISRKDVASSVETPRQAGVGKKTGASARITGLAEASTSETVGTQTDTARSPAGTARAAATKAGPQRGPRTNAPTGTGQKIRNNSLTSEPHVAASGLFSPLAPN